MYRRRWAGEKQRIVLILTLEEVEEAGSVVLPEQVRFLVGECVQAWNGEAMGISRRWVEDAVGEVREEHRAAARLALLTALAS
jgi:hypothetical protein